ncbi:hypothetical protein DFAR_3960006 [Desulfarculales bacterium]
MPVDQWHETTNGPTLADAILDHMIHNAYNIKLKRKFMKKTLANLTGDKILVAQCKHQRRRAMATRPTSPD